MSVTEIEERMASIMLESNYEQVKAKYNELLQVMGNIDGDEVVALVLVAQDISDV